MATRKFKQSSTNAAILATVCVAIAFLYASCAQSPAAVDPEATRGVTISGTSVTFGAQVVGTTSPSQIVSLTNNGDPTVNIASILLTGPDASDFSLTDTCGSSVAPKAKCTASLAFTPSGTGNRTAFLSITDDAPGSPQLVSLAGVGSNPQPGLTSLSPSLALAGAGAQTLSLTGANFLSSSTVTYNGVGHAATFVSATQLTILLSAADQATAGSYAVVVTNPAPGGGASNPVNFTVTVNNPVPSVSSLSPASAVAGTGAQTLTLIGSNFLSSSTVTYNGVGHAATFVSATQLTILLSAADQATAGNYAVVVTNPSPGGGSSSPVNFTVTVNNPSPTLASLSPSSVAAGAGAQTLTLTGANFESTSTVTYNGVGHTATFVSATQLTILLSAADQATAGSYAVVVTNPGPGGGTSGSVNFTVNVNNPSPTLASLSPSSVAAGSGAQTLTLTGTNFESTSTVTYNGVGHTATFVGATQLTILLSTADQATAGSYAVVVTNPAPGGGTSGSVNFTVNVNNPSPTLASLSPSSVAAGSGAQTLTLTGTNFESTSTVTYNGVGHAATFVSATQLTILLSAADQATAGSDAVVVTNPAPGGGVSSPVSFTVTGSGPTVGLSSTSLTFDTQYVGDTNTAPVVTVNNTGGTTLNITGIAVTGANAGDFAETDTCGSVGPGGSCTISVTFTPSLTSLENAAVTIMDNGASSPQAIGLSGTGMIAAGQFMVLSPDGTHLVNTFTGKPVFITGEQAYSLATNVASDSDIELYLSTRQSMGFNFIWVGAVDIAYLVDYPDNALGQPPFNGADFTNMNEAYWEHLDDVIQRAANHGFTVLLNAAFVGDGPWGCSEATGWCPDLLSSSDATLAAYGAYLGNRYKSYPNIVWMLGGDNDETDFPAMKAKTQDIVNGIRSADSVHLMTIENQCPFCSSQDNWPGGPWNINFLYHDAAGLAAAANANYTRGDYLPMFLGEDNLEGENTSPSNVGERTEAYQGVLGGATLGFQFGNCVIWSFGAEYPFCSTWTSSTQWKTWLNTPGAIGRMYAGELMRSREFWKLVPDINHTVVTAGYGSGDTVTVTGRASDGQTIIAYIPNGNATTLTVNMGQITSASSTAKCWWFNPSSGATTAIGTFATSGSKTFTPPDSNDWVLVIDDASATLPVPGGGNL